MDESLGFYDWLYNPRYGRNLSVGMVAGYLLNEAFSTIETIDMWERHAAACTDVLSARTETLRALVEGRWRIDTLPDGDPDTRYFQQLINKSWEHPLGPADWLHEYGNLTTEFERYLGALVGDYARTPDIKVLKPILGHGQHQSTRRRPLQSHWGHAESRRGSE